jgi:serine/threonine-protein kinase
MNPSNDGDFDASIPASQPLDVPSGPLEVLPQCWMVGHRNPDSLLQCNTYVRTFDSDNSPVHVCVDPGSQFDFPVVEANIARVVGDLSEIHSFSLNHQDPDVVGNATYLCDANPNISALVSEDTWRLVQHLLIKPGRVHFANAVKSRMTVLGKQHRWQLVPTPFCHFRGAMAFYDVEMRTLFSGDLFGGLNQLGRVHLFAKEQDWTGIAQFHQIYMPTREALRHAVRQIRALDPPVEIIAPQHGYVITGELVPLFLERMYELLVGTDLVIAEVDESYLPSYAEVIRQVIETAGETLGLDEVRKRLTDPNIQDGLASLFQLKANDFVVLSQGYSALLKAFARVISNESQEFMNQIRSVVLHACSERNLPIPPIGAGLSEATPADPTRSDEGPSQFWWLDEE